VEARAEAVEGRMGFLHDSFEVGFRYARDVLRKRQKMSLVDSEKFVLTLLRSIAFVHHAIGPILLNSTVYQLGEISCVALSSVA
jgi:hypothetical protein